MTATEMELRVAEAMGGVGCDDYWVDLARIAIRAMRGPTDRMLVSCLNVPILGPHATGRDYDRAHYNAMIDAASPGDET